MSDLSQELRDYPAVDPSRTIIAVDPLPDGYCIVPRTSVLQAADEIDDLKSANQILHALLNNRDAEIDRLRAQLSGAWNAWETVKTQLASARKALRTSLTAMTLASGFEVISLEFEFRHAIAEARAALTDEQRFDFVVDVDPDR